MAFAVMLLSLVGCKPLEESNKFQAATVNSLFGNPGTVFRTETESG